MKIKTRMKWRSKTRTRMRWWAPTSAVRAGSIRGGAGEVLGEVCPASGTKSPSCKYKYKYKYQHWFAKPSLLS